MERPTAPAPVRVISAVVVAPLLLLLLLPVGSSCTGRKPVVGEGEGEGEQGEGEGEAGEGEGEEGEGEGGFDDHTRGGLADFAAYQALAKEGPSSSAVKFMITRFGDDEGGAAVRFYDAGFYALHDEVYWFRLLNGQAIDGLDDALDQPVTTSHGPFVSIEEITRWARAERLAGRELPLDLTFVQGDERLYSPRFYDLALYQQPRALGIGTLLHFPAVTTSEGSRDEIWAVELEFSDEPTADELRVFFDEIDEAVGDDVAVNLKWITRSLAQEEIAAALPDDLRDRTLRYADVVVPGQQEVYAEGLTAGRLLIVRRGDEALLLTSRPPDVLVVEDVPDFLPACAALLTAAPQTALAHVNLLARNRGIPNAFVAGVTDDPNLDQLARVRAPVIVSAQLDEGDGGTGTVVVRAMSDADFATFRTLTTPEPTAVPPIDLTDVVDVYDLQSIAFADADDVRPFLGGKSAGFLALTSAGVVTVERPQGISIKPYLEHLSTTTALNTRIFEMLADRSFQGDITVRKLVLEGPNPPPTEEQNGQPVDPEFVDAFRAGRPPGNVLRDLVDDGGVMGIIRSTPMAPATLASITASLEDTFGHYADEQGLRFRSSSNVEDAEGFNGAGLYTSNTGRLHPDVGQASIEDAIKETWASYWGPEAFEERRLASVDHLSGSMGVVVHANFPDRQEKNNGVAIFTILPPKLAGDDDHDAFVLEVNQQQGSLSVTNPPPGSPHLPEIDRVVDDGSGVLRIERVRGSTVLLPGAFVLDDATLLAMFEDAKSITEQWLALENTGVFASQRRSTLTLDFETRFVAAGWPALQSGVQRPSRLVWKQARTLEPSSTRAPSSVQELPIPRDILARARRVVRHACDGDALTLIATDVITDDALPPDMGHAIDPFTAFVSITFKQAAPDIDVTAARQQRSALHTAFASVSHPVPDWSLDVEIAADRQATLRLEHVSVGADGLVVVDNGGTLVAPTTCTSEVLFAAPADFLAGLLAADEAEGP